MANVVVVGAGPAGLSVAIHLARRGHSVRVLERRAEPQRKPCGEGLFPRGVRELSKLGLDAVRDLGAEPIAAVRFMAGKRQASAPIRSPDVGAIGVRREALGRALQDLSIRKGVVIERTVQVTGWSVEQGRVVALKTVSGMVAADWMVAADGAGSRLRRLAGLDASPRGGRYGVSARVALAAPPPASIDVWFGPGFEVYLTPLGGSLANVALLLGRERMRGFAGQLDAAFRAHAGRAPSLAGGFEIVAPPLASGPAPVRARRAYRGNVVLVGDAAGFFDGITGEGMSVALTSGRMAAAAIDACERGRAAHPLAAYDRRLHQLTRSSGLLARLALFLGRHPALAEAAVANLAREPLAFERLVAVNAGELPLSALRPGDLWALATGR